MLSPEKIYEFFMDLMLGKIEIAEIDGTFSLDAMAEHLKR